MTEQATSSFTIGDRQVGAGAPVFVIAEAGVNHDGSTTKAHELIDAAADASADAVKFQTFTPDALVTRDAPTAEYQQKAVGATDQHSMLADLTLPDSAWAELASHAHDRQIAFMSTPFDPASLELLVDVGVPAIKISSGDISNFVLLRAAAATGLPVIVSSGASTFMDVERALELFEPSSAVAILHCVTAYPAPLEASNLRVLAELRSRFGRVVGWSDHTVGLESALMATALEVSIIEKHLTLDVSGTGPDHQASVDPEGLALYMAAVRAAEVAMGNGCKAADVAEIANRDVVRRSLHAGRDLEIGSVLKESDLIALRPGGGVGADTSYEGRRLTRSLVAGEALQSGDLADHPQ